MIQLTQRQARRFLLLHHGLLGPHRFHGKEGALAFIRQCGCIQFDPVDACGRNAELTLQSRVQGFKKKTLQQLLYADRLLLDYPDKELAILPTEDWPCFERFRRAARENGKQFAELSDLEEQAAGYIAAHGPVDASMLPFRGKKIRWHSAIHWSGNWQGESDAARSVLEQMYSDGRLVIHHKDGARKSYDLAERCLPGNILSAADPLPDGFDHLQWRVLRRIGAVGMLPDRRSDAFLGIWDLDSDARSRAFQSLKQSERITQVQLEGFRSPLFLRTADLPTLEIALSDQRFPPRCEFLAPLDPLLWDRKLIREIFGFSYTWEIYVPADKRKYGYYVLPILYGESFLGRIEAAAHAKESTLEIKGLWWEAGVQPRPAAVRRAVQRLAKLNQCEEIIDPKRVLFP